MPSDEVLLVALRVARAWRRRKGVLGIGLGQRHRDGAFDASEMCVVVTVQAKARSGTLPVRQVFPAEIVVDLDGVRYSVPVDVRGARGAEGIVCQGQVGGGVAVNGRTGALGPLVITPTGPQFLVSGHVAVDTTARLHLPWGADTSISGVWITTTLDHALAHAPAGLDASAGLRTDGKAISAVVVPMSSLSGKSVTCYRPTTAEWVTTVIRDWSADHWVDSRGGKPKMYMTGLVSTDAVTVAGDSGTALFLSSTGALIGTLLGAVHPQGAHEPALSFFLPAETAFAALGVELP